jgi:2,4-dienoyl-CoA reductase-like NADH-dependent reductase (Old Yellow Enzyme family)
MKTQIDKKRFGPWALVTGASSGIGKEFARRKLRCVERAGPPAERGNRLIAEGLADLVAFGRPYIANPDLVERLATGAPLAEVDWKTVYGSGPRGYSDYPAIRRAAGE